MKNKPGRFIKPEKKKEEVVEEVIKVITLPETITIKDLADKMKLQPSALIKKLFLKGEIYTVNSEISFEKADLDTFRGLKFAYDALKIGGSMPTVMNAANEFAVAKFLNKKVRFLEIYDMIEFCMERHQLIENPTVEEILETEQWVYETIESRWIS